VRPPDRGAYGGKTIGAHKEEYEKEEIKIEIESEYEPAYRPKFRVTMFGEFKISYDGKEIHLKQGKSTKAIQILQYLLCHYPDGAPVAAMLDNIFGNDDVLNPKNNLKVSVSQLRRQLADAGLPGEKYVTVVGGRYCWSDELAPVIDINEFSDAVSKAQKKKNGNCKLILLRQAIDLYAGNFLPHLAGIDWAEELNAYYIRMFSETVRTFADILKQEGAWEEILPVAEKANRILHAEEWQVLRIECLMHLGRWEEAKRVYNEAVAVLKKEYDLPPSEELTRQYALISRQIANQFCTFDEVLHDLEENHDQGGAYMCTYPGFIDLYRVAVRSMLRSGINCCVMLCTVSRRDGGAMQNAERLAEAAEKVSKSIGSALRRGDFYARFNESQFIICLSGTCLENCDIVADRIRSHYQREPVRGAHLFFEEKAATVDGFSSEEAFSGWR